MRYSAIQKASFLARPNRFIARVMVEGREETVHVKNTGRCRELLTPGCQVWLEKADKPGRKTGYDLVAVQKGELLINMDAQAPNQVFAEWAREGGFVPGLTVLRAETTWGTSRFDFYWEAGERKGFVEVKGCTLEENGYAKFPDAPTQRGVKHLEELIQAKRAGYEAAVCFVLQMSPMRCFSPNDATHPAFGQALRRAAEAGVTVLAVQCAVTPESLSITQPVPLWLDRRTPPPIPPYPPEDWKGVPAPVECGEELVELTREAPEIGYAAVYARAGRPGAQERCLVRRGVAERLKRAAAALPSGYSLLIYDTLRPLSVQRDLYEECWENMRLAYPEESEEERKRRVEDFVACPREDPARPAPHTTGGAVDLTLCRDGVPVWMGTEFDDSTQRAWTRWLEESEEDPEARDHRRLLYHTMAEAGFASYSCEWWHFAYGERMWAMFHRATPRYGFHPSCKEERL